MKVKLTNQVYDYLKRNNQLNSTAINCKLINNHLLLLTLNDNNANEIREWAIDKLPQVGFDNNYVLNEEGKILEVIIDKFFI